MTVGATVGFEKLTKQTLLPEFWSYLRSKGFTNLRIQCGPDVSWASKELQSTLSSSASEASDPYDDGLKVEVFEMSKNLMRDEMTLCKPREGERTQGIVISHAGKLVGRRKMKRTITEWFLIL